METVSIRYIIDEVDAAADFYVRQLGFEVQQDLEATVARLRDGGARFRSASSRATVVGRPWSPIPRAT